MKAPFDIHRQEALPRICKMLGLEAAKLTQADKAALLDRFYSVPHAQRRDGQLLASVLEPVETVLKAFGNAETQTTVRRLPDLQRRLHAIAARAVQLAAA